eukprot:TRINITY_DN19412_c0_g1_i1.p1 TRINITY_DN19412_c0_g1~~TRINITY_DN19412_c0_g1_i1.p1  ORF type:complete len:850 (+),score=295.64 TRINITY_DN19412_c0_g1_i1:141-2690(+)
MPSVTVTYPSKHTPHTTAAVAFQAADPTALVSFACDKKAANASASPAEANGETVTGDYNVARYLVRAAPELQYLYGLSAAESSEVDQWIAVATAVTRASSIEEFTALAADLERHLAMRTFLVGRTMSLADIAAWSAFAKHAQWKSVSSRVLPSHPSFSRWFKYHDRQASFAAAAECLSASKQVKAVANPPTTVSEYHDRVANAMRAILTSAGIKDVSKLVLTNPPPGVKGADLCLGCFPYAKEMGKKPPEIAGILAEKVESADSEVFISAAAAGPYLNLGIHPQYLASAALGEVLNPPTIPDTGDHIVLEFSSPNTNKPQHLGHVRNNLIGSSTANILKYAGNKVTRVNLINDRGIHICKSMLAYKLFGDGEDPESSGIKGDHLVGKYYVVFENKFRAEYAEWLASDEGKARCEAWFQEEDGKKVLRKYDSLRDKAKKIKDAKKQAAQLAALDKDNMTIFKEEYKEKYFNKESKLGQQASTMLVQWEAGDKEVRELWSMMNSWVFDGFNATYKRMGIEFDHIDKESITYVLGKEIVELGLERGVMEVLPNGATACDLEKNFGMPKGSGKKVLLRANGTTVYMTQDLGTAFSRMDKFNANRMIYVVANEQDYHFAVLFKILGLLRPEMDGRCYHLSYGMVNLPSGRMKSREGTVVDADDLIDSLVALSREKTKEKWPELEGADLENRALLIGLAALKFYMLAFAPSSTVMFDPEKSIDFTGKTGPYMLYSYARSRSVLNKCGVTDDDVPYAPERVAGLATQEERDTLNRLALFHAELAAAAADKDPSKVCTALFEVGQAFNSFYHNKNKHPIIDCPDPDLKNARLQLCRAVCAAIKKGLALLGIDVLERM